MEKQLRNLEGDLSPTTRNELAIKLSETGDRRVYDALKRLIRRDDLKDTRGTLVHCLGSFEYTDAFQLLVELVGSGNWEVAHEAFQLLNKIEELNGPDVRRGRKILGQYQNTSGPEWRLKMLDDLAEMFEP